MMPKESFGKGKEIIARRSLADDCPWCPAKAGETCLRYDYDHPGHPKERGSEARAQLDSFPFECGARNEETDAFCQLKKGHAGSHYGQSRSLHKPLAWSEPSVAPGEYERPEPQGQIPEPTCELVDDGDYCTTHLQPSNLCRAAQPAAAQAEEIPQRAAEDAAWSIMGRERHLATAVKLVRAEAALTSCREERDTANEQLDRTVQDRDKAWASQKYYSNLLDKEKKAWCDVAAELGRMREERDRVQAALREMLSLFTQEPKMYLRPCDPSHRMTYADSDRVDAAFIAADAALKPVSDRQPEGETK